MPTPGPMELIIILVIVLVIFGPKRLPSLGRSIGSGMREFKDSVSSKSGDSEDETPQVLEASAAEQPAAAGQPSSGEAPDAIGDPPRAAG
ncbi:MAG: twin-arginine translocase TatA/TatE family subunit [Baekduia sp.]